MTPDVFRIMVDTSVKRSERFKHSFLPWAFIERWRVAIEKNHHQTLEVLHSRGGLSPAEIYCAALGISISEVFEGRVTDQIGIDWLAKEWDKFNSAD